MNNKMEIGNTKLVMKYTINTYIYIYTTERKPGCDYRNHGFYLVQLNSVPGICINVQITRIIK